MRIVEQTTTTDALWYLPEQKPVPQSRFGVRDWQLFFPFKEAARQLGLYHPNWKYLSSWHLRPLKTLTYLEEDITFGQLKELGLDKCLPRDSTQRDEHDPTFVHWWYEGDVFTFDEIDRWRKKKGFDENKITASAEEALVRNATFTALKRQGYDSLLIRFDLPDIWKYDEMIVFDPTRVSFVEMLDANGNPLAAPKQSGDLF